MHEFLLGTIFGIASTFLALSLIVLNHDINKTEDFDASVKCLEKDSKLVRQKSEIYFCENGYSFKNPSW